MVHGALIEAEISTSPLPMYLLNSTQVLGTVILPTSMSTPLKWSKNVSMCLRNIQKHLVHASTMRNEHNLISDVPTPNPLGVYVLAPDPQGSCPGT